jgi:hypothetical protein
MRFYAFGSLCDFLMILFCVLLDNLLVRFHGSFAVMRFTFRDFMFFIAYFVFHAKAYMKVSWVEGG